MRLIKKVIDWMRESAMTRKMNRLKAIMASDTRMAEGDLERLSRKYAKGMLNGIGEIMDRELGVFLQILADCNAAATEAGGEAVRLVEVFNGILVEVGKLRKLIRGELLKAKIRIIARSVKREDQD